MTRAKEYYLNFVILNREGERKRPTIVSDLNSDGSIKADDSLLKFIDANKEDTLRTISDIQEYDYNTYEYLYEDAATVYGSYGEYGVLISPPPRLRFVNFEIPIEHLLEILNEWLDFLNSTPYEY